MRGFVITILSVTLIMILILLAISLRNAQLSSERALLEPLPMIYGASLLDDIAYELNTMIGPQISIEERNDSTVLTISDTLQSHNYSSEMSLYDSFLTEEVAARSASNISVNFTNLTDGEITIFINEDYTYINDHRNNKTLFTRNGGTNATSYDISFVITAIRANVTAMEFNESGTINVTIEYTDLNGTTVEEGSVFPDRTNTMRVEYIGGSSMTITIGTINGESGSLSMESTGIRAETAWTVVLPQVNATKKTGYEYDAMINYTQGPVNIFRRIGK